MSLPARRAFLAGLAAATAAPAAGVAAPSGFPVDIRLGPPPQPVMQDGRLHLVYELRLTNFNRGAAIEVTRLEVLAPGGPPLATLGGPDLERLADPIGAPEDAKRPRLIGSGRSLAIFLDVALNPGVRPPARLHHRLSLAAEGRTQRLEGAIDGLETPVIATPVPLLHPPLRGAGWLAANGLAAPDHRRAYVTVDGHARIAQRFAIDWVQLGPDGRLYRTDGKANADFYGDGADLLAVADGRVAQIKDGLPENAGNNTRRAIPITLETLAGNHLLLDIGQGRFALYAHIRPGSFRVKPGDRVRVGQVLARLGNSGNSDAPHLHFHLVDGPSPMAAEGVPYAFSSFTQLGVAGDPAVLESNAAWTPRTSPVVRHGELPADNAVVVFA